MKPTNIQQTTEAAPVTGTPLPKIGRRAEMARQAQLSAFIDKVMEPQLLMTPREQAIWHLRELEQLLRDDGGKEITVTAIGTYSSNEDCRLIGIHYSGRLTCDDNMFVGKAVQA